MEHGIRTFNPREQRLEDTIMRICIVGCGAIGSIYAGHLARLEDVEVFAYDVWEDHVRAIREDGLTLTGERSFTTSLEATSNPDEIPPCDLGILATKATHTEAAMEQTQDVFQPDGVVAEVQNGIGSEAIVARYVDRVLSGSTFQAGKILDPGRVLFEIPGVSFIETGETTALGPFKESRATKKEAEELAGVLNRAGLKAIAVEDILGIKWTKLGFNSATNPTGALSRQYELDTMSYQPTRELARELVQECKQVARAAGIDLYADPWDMVESVRDSIEGNHRSSMLTDVLNEQPTEIDFITGALVETAREHGVDVPRNETILALIRGLEQSWEAGDKAGT